MHGKITEFSLPTQYRFPARWEEKYIISIFSKNIQNGILGLKFKSRTVFVGAGNDIGTIYPPGLLRLMLLILRIDYRTASYYVSGYWGCEKERLYSVLDVLTSARGSFFFKIFSLFNKKHIVRDSIIYKLFPLKVKKNIAAHYNTDPDYMRLIIGSRLIYTCGFFENTKQALDQAQINKINLVGERLSLKHTDTVLELGCGWGEAAKQLSKNFRCEVTGLSISSGQINYAQKHKIAGTAFIHSDYQKHDKFDVYDKIYSIGMLEHIGKNKHHEYFAKINHLLKAGGKALIHSIVRGESGSTNSWIDDAVFPGAYIPTVSELARAIEDNGFRIEEIYVHSKENYFRTLECWLSNFYKNHMKLRDVLLQKVANTEAEEILRLWEFYLCGSKLSFNRRYGVCQNIQILIQKNIPPIVK